MYTTSTGTPTWQSVCKNTAYSSLTCLYYSSPLWYVPHVPSIHTCLLRALCHSCRPRLRYICHTKCCTRLPPPDGIYSGQRSPIGWLRHRRRREENRSSKWWSWFYSSNMVDEPFASSQDETGMLHFQLYIVLLHPSLPVLFRTNLLLEVLDPFQWVFPIAFRLLSCCGNNYRKREREQKVNVRANRWILTIWWMDGEYAIMPDNLWQW